MFTISVSAQDPWAMAKDERDAYFAKIRAASEQDHKAMLMLLDIGKLRQGANGNDPTAPNAANYDESKANPYPKLPDPLRLSGGKRVKQASQWWGQRRGEILQDFDQYVYGIQPAHTPTVKWQIVSTSNDSSGSIPVIKKQLMGHVDNSDYPEVTVDISLTLVAPANSTVPVPVILELSFNFPPGSGPPRPKGTSPDWKEQLIAKGWGYAQFVPTKFIILFPILVTRTFTQCVVKKISTLEKSRHH